MINQSRQNSDVFSSGGIFTFILTPVLCSSIFGALLVLYRLMFVTMAQFSLCNCGDATTCYLVGVPVCPNFLLHSECQLQSSFQQLFHLTTYDTILILLWFIVQVALPVTVRKLNLNEFYWGFPISVSSTVSKLLLIVPLWDTFISTCWLVQWVMRSESDCVLGEWWDSGTIMRWGAFSFFLLAFFLYQFADAKVGTPLTRAGMILGGYLAIGVLLLLAAIMSYLLTSVDPSSAQQVAWLDLGLLAAMFSADLFSYAASKVAHRLYVGPIVSSFWQKNTHRLKLREFANSPLGPFYFNAASHNVSDRNGTSSSIVLSSSHSWAHTPFQKDFVASAEYQAKKEKSAGSESDVPNFLEDCSRVTSRFKTSSSLLLKDAVAVSGAALSSNMGAKFNVPLALRWLMSMFSFNMGVWITLQDPGEDGASTKSEIINWLKIVLAQPLAMQLGLVIFYPMVIDGIRG